MIEVAYRKRDGKEKKEYTKEREREKCALLVQTDFLELLMA